MKIKTILVPTDFSEHAEKAFATAIQFAEAFEARIELLHVYDLGHFVALYEVNVPEDVIRATASRKLEPWVERAKKKGIEVSTHLVVDTPSQAIVERAEQQKADLIVMGTRGLGAVKHMLLGSVAERTVRRAPCPVLTVAADARTDA